MSITSLSASPLGVVESLAAITEGGLRNIKLLYREGTALGIVTEALAVRDEAR